LGINKVPELAQSKTSLKLKEKEHPAARDTNVEAVDEISKGLKHRIEAANQAADTAEKKVKIAYDYAIEVDKLRPREAAKILFDRLKYSPQWIRRYLPDEAKMMSRARYNPRPKLKFRIPPPKIEVQEAIIVDENTKEPVGTRMTTLAIVIPSERVKKFYNDILKIREKAEKIGLRINQDCSVTVNHV